MHWIHTDFTHWIHTEFMDWKHADFMHWTHWFYGLNTYWFYALKTHWIYALKILILYTENTLILCTGHTDDRLHVIAVYALKMYCFQCKRVKWMSEMIWWFCIFYFQLFCSTLKEWSPDLYNVQSVIKAVQVVTRVSCHDLWEYHTYQPACLYWSHYPNIVCLLSFTLEHYVWTPGHFLKGLWLASLKNRFPRFQTKKCCTFQYTLKETVSPKSRFAEHRR